MPTFHQVITAEGSYLVEVPDPTPEEIEQQRLEKLRDRGRNQRMIRDAALIQCDWTQVVDAPFSNELKAQWAAYRQALRDLPLHANWPNLVYDDWPTDPNGNKPVPTP